MHETTRPLTLGDNPAGQGLILVALALLAAGVVMVPSSLVTVGPGAEWYARADFRHVMFAAAAATVLLLMWRVDYRWLSAGKRFPYVAAGLLAGALATAPLVFVPGIGKSVGGYRRWVCFGPSRFGVGFQPSELIKLTMIVFLAMRLLPGDPILMLITSDDLSQSSEEQITALRHEFGLDKPLPVQYVNWLYGAVRGDLGVSILHRSDVTGEIIGRLPITLHLGLLAFVISIVVGIPMGVVSAVRRGGWLDTGVTLLANLGITVPVEEEPQ